jgi:hypothetical protein
MHKSHIPIAVRSHPFLHVQPKIATFAICFFTHLNSIRCAQPVQIWGKAVHTIRDACVRNKHLHTYLKRHAGWAVRKLVQIAPPYLSITHTSSYDFFAQFTDTVRHLSTLSTPPTITTTKYIKI